MTLPWHLVGLMGQPRRMAYYDYTDPALAPQAIWVSISAIGGFVLVFSALLLILGLGLLASCAGCWAAVSPLTFSLAVHPPRSLPRSLNSFRVWVLLVVALTHRELRLPRRAVAHARRTRGSPPIRSSTMTSDDRPGYARFPVRSLDRRYCCTFLVAGSSWVRLASLTPTQLGLLDLWTVDLPRGRLADRLRTQASSVRGKSAGLGRRMDSPRRGRLMARGDAARGAALATACNNCHGASGVSSDAAIPESGGPERRRNLQAARRLQERQAQHGSNGVFVGPAVAAGHPRPGDPLCVAAKPLRRVGGRIRRLHEWRRQSIKSAAHARHRVLCDLPWANGPLVPGSPRLARPAARVSGTGDAGVQVRLRGATTSASRCATLLAKLTRRGDCAARRLLLDFRKMRACVLH